MPKNRPMRGRKVPRGGQSTRGGRLRPTVPKVVMENSFAPAKEDLDHPDNVCRLCMVRGGPTMEPIFCNSGVNSIGAQITWVTQLEMRREDPLPSRVCQQCIFRLTLSQNFKQQCVASDTTLRESYLGKSGDDIAASSQGGGPNSPKEASVIDTSYTLKVEPLSPCGLEGDYDDPGVKEFKIEIVEHSLDGPTEKTGKGGKGPFVCEVCQRTYPSWDRLRRHRVYHSEKRIPCPECDRKFLRRAQLRRHLLWHSGERPFSCTVCDKSFAAQTTLDVHVRSHSGAKPFGCHLCDKTFGHNSTLTTHVRAHLGDRPYRCPSCPLTFTAKSPLDKHVRTHTGFKPHKCPECPLAFTLPSSLRTHSRTHTGERPFRCPHCDKSFAQPGGLKNHERIHTGSKPFECGVCRKAYRQQGAYAIHMRTHANIRPYSCDVCSRSFTVKKTLARHIRVHTGEKSFECPVCGQAFSRDDGLASHLSIHSSERPFQCDTCSKRFRQKMALVLHMRCHSGERPYRCIHCPMTFAQKGTMTTHMRVHTGEKPFGCSQCEKVFGQLGNLIDHKKRHHPYGEDPKGDETIQDLLDEMDDGCEDKEDGSDEDSLGKTEDKVLLHCCQLCSKTFLKLKTLIWHVERFHSYTDETRKKKKERKMKREKCGKELYDDPGRSTLDTRAGGPLKTDIKSEIMTDDGTCAKKSSASVIGEPMNVQLSTNVARSADATVVAEMCAAAFRSEDKTKKTVFQSPPTSQAIVSSSSSVKGNEIPNTTSRCVDGDRSNVDSIESTPTFAEGAETVSSDSKTAVTDVANHQTVEHNSFNTRFKGRPTSPTAETVGTATSDVLEVVNSNVTEMETENTGFSDGFIENISNPNTYLHV